MNKKLTQKILKRSRLITNLNKVFTLHTIYPLQVLYAAAVISLKFIVAMFIIILCNVYLCFVEKFMIYLIEHSSY